MVEVLVCQHDMGDRDLGDARRTSAPIAAASASVVPVSTSSVPVGPGPIRRDIAERQPTPMHACRSSCSQAKCTQCNVALRARPKKYSSLGLPRTPGRRALTCARNSRRILRDVATSDRIFLALANPVRRELSEILTRQQLASRRTAAQLGERLAMFEKFWRRFCWPSSPRQQRSWNDRDSTPARSGSTNSSRPRRRRYGGC